MKFTVTMKDPDTLHDAIDDAVREDVAGIEGLSKEDRAALFETRQDAVRAVARKWFKYSEYVTIEIDTEAKTATVCAA